MYAFLNKYGQALAFGIGVLVTLIFLLGIFTAPAAEMEATSLDGSPPEKYVTTAFDFGIMISVILTVLAFIVAGIFGAAQFASNPKGALKGLLGLAALVVIALIAYSTVNGDIAQESPEIINSINKFKTDQETDFGSGTLKFVSGSILTSLVLIGLAVLTLVGFGVRSIFK
ncbi:hypothetical protein QWY85_15120 [Neolewinella lacunae]|uniref:Uncharacterized protein n=1 Tax=Neolewinella lacunae TaxID=1517758 RepID=A0A923PEQ8_9BACT|nr:hypothetical protein [Neolewinella lacunae]MBC6992753.1 hypothetical protein [Neolewinella lacunae]MDN3635997.1 hypothetical protein [Neolewinella lacunae]